MKFHLGEIRNMKDPLIRLLDKEIPVKSAWKLNKLVKCFDKELADIEEFRITLVQKLGETDEETGSVQVPDDKMAGFIEEFNALLQTEVEYEYEPMSIDELGSNATISAKDMMAMDKLFN